MIEFGSQTMKHWILTGGCSLLLAVSSTLAAPPAQAMATHSTTAIHQTTPFNLAYLAYRGNLAAYGIPSYNALVFALRSGQLDADKIVDQAVAAHLVTPETADDREYVSAVEGMLQDLLNLDT
jgi:hypothetical protein